MDSWRLRLVEEMETQRLDMKNLSLKAGLGPTYIRDLLKRGRGGKVEDVDKLAHALGVTFEWLMTGSGSRLPQMRKPVVPAAAPPSEPDDDPTTAVSVRRVPVVGDVAAGTWLQDEGLSADEMEYSPFPPDPSLPAEHQFEVVVKGTSINKFAQPGERLRCVSLHAPGVEPIDKDLVIVRRSRLGGQLVEMTAKRLLKTPEGMLLMPDSTDPRWQTPISVTGGHDASDSTVTVEIVGLALYVYRPARVAG